MGQIEIAIGICHSLMEATQRSKCFTLGTLDGFTWFFRIIISGEPGTYSCLDQTCHKWSPDLCSWCRCLPIAPNSLHSRRRPIYYLLALALPPPASHQAAGYLTLNHPSRSAFPWDQQFSTKQFCVSNLRASSCCPQQLAFFPNLCGHHLLRSCSCIVSFWFEDTKSPFLCQHSPTRASAPPSSWLCLVGGRGSCGPSLTRECECGEPKTKNRESPKSKSIQSRNESD